MGNLKDIAKELSDDILSNKEWLNRAISFVIDGSYGIESELLNKDLLSTYDKSKARRGKRGCNLIARIGNIFIQKAYNCNSNQALSTWKYLSKDDQDYLDITVIDLLDSYMEQI